MNMPIFNYSSLKNDDYCFVIAEAGSNHEHDKKNAFELIEVAAGAGADAVKFQLFTADKLYSKTIGNEIYEKTSNLELPLEWVPELIDVCKSNNIMFLGTPFDYDSVDVLNRENVAAFKWASGEIDNIDLLKHAARSSKPILISTGMCDLSTIESAIEAVREQNNNQIVLLHCISLYPTHYEDANLRMMDNLSDSFHFPVGFSDHTLGSTISIAAVARGAKVLEKHFTLDKNLKSPDHPFSLRPNELKDLITKIREVTESLGISEKRMIEKERPISEIARRSFVAKQFISKGSILTAEMLSLKRPGKGISPKYSAYILGRTLNKDIEKDQIILLNDFI
jgi:N-acetylneuraminate synthase/N,N'-diacetyllegionaminate synthase